MNRVAIIGAGLSGLAAGWELSRRGLDVVVFEKSRGLSGRAASRGHGAVRYDHGANFFRTSDPEVYTLVHEVLPTDDLVEIPGGVPVTLLAGLKGAAEEETSLDETGWKRISFSKGCKFHFIFSGALLFV